MFVLERKKQCRFMNSSANVAVSLKNWSGWIPKRSSVPIATTRPKKYFPHAASNSKAVDGMPMDMHHRKNSRQIEPLPKNNRRFYISKPFRPILGCLIVCIWKNTFYQWNCVQRQPCCLLILTFFVLWERTGPLLCLEVCRFFAFVLPYRSKGNLT